MQGQGMNGTGQFLAQEPVDELVPFDLAEAFEGFRHGNQLEVRIRPRPRMHVALIEELEVLRLEGSLHLALDAGFDGGSVCGFGHG